MSSVRWGKTKAQKSRTETGNHVIVLAAFTKLVLPLCLFLSEKMATTQKKSQLFKEINGLRRWTVNLDETSLSQVLQLNRCSAEDQELESPSNKHLLLCNHLSTHFTHLLSLVVVIVLSPGSLILKRTNSASVLAKESSFFCPFTNTKGYCAGLLSCNSVLSRR